MRPRSLLAQAGLIAGRRKHVTGRYETILVGVPTLTDDEFSEIVSSLQATVTEGKGTVIRTEPWGKRKLAYRVQKFDEAHYALLFYEGPSSLVHELERRIRMNERLMRFLTVKVDWEEKVARAAAEKAARRPRSTGEAAVVEDGRFRYEGAADDEGER